MSDGQPIIINTERISDTTNMLTFSNDEVLFGCTWPKCNYVVDTRESVPRHYKTHSGQAAQKRRADRRPRSAVVVNEVDVVTRYSAIYLWNQPQNRLNTTPAWDNFHIPIVVE